MRVNIKGDVRRVVRDFKHLRKTVVPQAFAQAANRAMRGVRTETTRELAGLKNVKQKIIRQRFRMFSASRNRMATELILRYSRVPVVITGNAKETRRGVRVGRRSIPGAFIGKGRNRTAVFKRADGVARFPIKEQVIQLEPEARVFTKRNVRTVGRRRFKKEFRRILNLKLKKRGR